MITQLRDSRLRIAFLTQLDPLDKRSNSGRLYQMGQSLQKHCGDVTYLGPLSLPEQSLRSRAMAKASQVLFKKRYLHWLSLETARKLGSVAEQKLAGQTFDVIIITAGGVYTAYLKTDIPVVLVGDATFAQIINYYSYYSNLSRCSVREIHILEQKVFKKVRTAIMSSEWAVRSAVQDYHFDPEHAHVVPFGANLDTIPTRETVYESRPSGRCRLLFVGIDWERKGGDIAYETLLELEKAGIEAELIVCGCVPPAGVTHSRMTIIPFLDKNDERQMHEIEKLYAMADFLLVPTRSESFGLIFCEAAAFGLPTITTRTGGVPEVVREGENGYILPLEARGDAYAKVIADLFRDEDRYLRLMQSSRATFEDRLNWDEWGRCVHDILVKECEKANIATEAVYLGK